MMYARIRTFVTRRPRLYRVVRTTRTLFLIGPLRRLLVARERRTSRGKPPPNVGPTLFRRVDIEGATETLERDGVAMIGQLPEEATDRIVEYFYDRGRQSIQNAHLESEAVRRVALDSTLIETARQYLGGEPIPQLCRMWISVPGADFAHAHRFHFDVAEPKSVTMFAYLTDVEDPAHGAHVVIKGTHNRKTFRDHWKGYLDEAEAKDRFGAQVTPILGRRGSVFMEELTIFHRGTPPEHTRLIMVVVYTLKRKASESVEVGAPLKLPTRTRTPVRERSALIASSGYRPGTPNPPRAKRSTRIALSDPQRPDSDNAPSRTMSSPGSSSLRAPSNE